jgi:hypothetical protein
MKELACHYAIARFLPYSDGGEFVNVGVIICCPSTGFLNFQIESRKRKRVTDFFPELAVEFYRDGLNAWREDLRRIHLASNSTAEAAAYFAEAVKPKATAFRFGPVGSVLTTNPQEELESLFKRYVLRQYEETTAQPEVILRRQLSGILRDHHLNIFYTEKRLGGEELPTVLPFVNWPQEMKRPFKAMKPLHFDRENPSDVYEHADYWIQRVKRLRKRNMWPEETLFAVQPPRKSGIVHRAYLEVEADLIALGIEVKPLSQTGSILAFAREGVNKQPFVGA